MGDIELIAMVEIAFEWAPSFPSKEGGVGHHA